MATILVTDDDPDIGNLLEEALTKAGYTVLRACSGTEALSILQKHSPDLILLDLMMPGLSGEQLLPQIRNIPVIVVSAKIDLENKVSLLLGGAADYITKPFEIRELLARVAVQLRNTNAAERTDQLVFDEIRLGGDAHSVNVSGKNIRLTRTEFAILKLLMQNPEQVVTKSAILEQISADTPDCTELSLKQHISNLRKKLRQPSGKDYIEAIWGIGFRLGVPQEKS